MRAGGRGRGHRRRSRPAAAPRTATSARSPGASRRPVRAVRLDIPSLVRGRARDGRHRRDRVLHRRRGARARRAADGAGPRRASTAITDDGRDQRRLLARHPHPRAGRGAGASSACTATTTTSRRRARTSATSSRRTRGRSAGRRCELVRELGMEVCCGGIIGMGETLEQRAELAAQFAALDPDEVPLNFLDPRPGTPFADARAGADAGTRCARSPPSGSRCRARSCASPAGAS